MKWWTLYDNISGEIIQFADKYRAEAEAERRVSLHRSGYDVRRNHIAGCDAVLIEKGNHIIICIRPEANYEEDC